MDPWWLRDDGDAIGPGRSPDEIFGSLHQDVVKDDHFFQTVTEIRRSSELTNTDYNDLETLLYNRATCESPTFQDGATFDHSEMSLLSPEMVQCDQSNSPAGSSTGSDLKPLSPKSNQGTPHHPRKWNEDFSSCHESEVLDRQTPTPPDQNEPCKNNIGAKEATIVSDVCTSGNKSNSDVKSIEKNSWNTDDILNSLVEQCSGYNASGIPYEVFSLPNSCSPPSVPPIGGYVTPPWSPDFSQNVVSVPVSPLTGEVNDIITPRHTSDQSYLVPGPLLDTLTSCTLNNTFKNAFYCQFCGREFKHKIGLKNHERSHLRGETHICVYCRKSFRYKNKLRRHLGVHVREMRICRYCGEVQGNDYELVQHEKRHKKDDKKLIDEMMDSFALTSNSCNSLDIVFTEGKPCPPENIIVPMQCYQDQPWTSMCMNTAIAGGKTTHTFPKPMRYHSV